MGWRDFLRRTFGAGVPQPTTDAGQSTGDVAAPTPENARTDADLPPRQASAAPEDGILPTSYGALGLLPPLSDLTDDELRAALRLRIVSLDSLPTVEGLPHLRAIAPGVVEILTIDLPGTIVTPPGSAVAHLGPVDELVALGRAHLRALVGPELYSRQIRAEDGLTFSFLYGEDYSLSSVALVLPAALAHVAPGLDLATGVVVAVPDRHHVAYRAIEGLESLMALGPMAAFARSGFEAEDGPVSPEVYWARGPRLDHWEQLTQQAPDGIAIHVPAELAALIEPD